MPYFEHSGLSLYYTEIGKGMPFIFQHGLGGSIDQILKIYSPLSGIRLITFDFRAHGKTPIDGIYTLNFKTFADDVSVLMDYLNLDKAIIGGISMGAGVALNFTLRYPDRVLALILSRPAWLDRPMEKQNRELYAFIFKLINECGPERGRELLMASDIYNRLSKSFPGIAESLLTYFNYEKVTETAARFKSIPEDMPGDDRGKWKQIAVPTLVLANKSDPIHPFEYGVEYASGINGADFREITSKSISEEQHREDVQKNIDSFLTDLLNKKSFRVKH